MKRERFRTEGVFLRSVARLPRPASCTRFSTSSRTARRCLGHTCRASSKKVVRAAGSAARNSERRRCPLRVLQGAHAVTRLPPSGHPRALAPARGPPSAPPADGPPRSTRTGSRRARRRPHASRTSMKNPLDPRRMMLGAAKRLFLDPLDPDAPAAPDPNDEPPRLTPKALGKTRTMSRSRDRILANLDDMYREAFERAKANGDNGQMVTLDFAYRREQLYFEILLDVRDAIEKIK